MSEFSRGTDNIPAHGLLCPSCRVDLVMSERQGIEIDYCPKCRGVWLDRGELDKIIERSTAEEARMAAQAAPPPEPQAAPPASFFAGTPDHGGHGARRGGHGENRGEHGEYRSGHGPQGGGRKRGVGSFLGELFD